MSAFNRNLLTTETPKDYAIPTPPTDGITQLAFSPIADYLAVSSWDNQVRIYEVNQAAGSAVGKALYPHEGPALCCTWSKDGTKVFSGGADKAGRMFDTATGQAMQVAQHDAPIKCIKWVDSGATSVLATGSWDKTLKYWDLRTPQPVLNVSLPERCYAMDLIFPLMVAATAERHVMIYDMRNPGTVFKQSQSPLKWQTRTVACFIAANGYAIGSIEGRVGIQYLDEKDNQTTSFSFKCHRENNVNVYAVNAISFHPLHGTFSTAGSDGTFNFWDKDSKQRLKGFSSIGCPIMATTFNRNGSIFAYAAGYDWSKGYQQPTYQTQQMKDSIFLHAVKDDDVKPRPAKKR
ncbi:3487_t:CDS:2 [Ambispora gerdemannii]|uniref:3487_t:CDS:1 n=1 Tax=Ambispora gerdemannii TaxID=144530 RepID=A0A9N8VFY3_9GLOM|nr:3487_t:CDS:2 [Ambispora gerdemannii]